MHFALPGLITGYYNGYKKDWGIMESFHISTTATKTTTTTTGAALSSITTSLLVSELGRKEHLSPVLIRCVFKIL